MIFMRFLLPNHMMGSLLQVDKSFGLDMMHHLRWFVLLGLHMCVQQ